MELLGYLDQNWMTLRALIKSIDFIAQKITKYQNEKKQRNKTKGIKMFCYFIGQLFGVRSYQYDSMIDKRQNLF